MARNRGWIGSGLWDRNTYWPWKEVFGMHLRDSLVVSRDWHYR